MKYINRIGCFALMLLCLFGYGCDMQDVLIKTLATESPVISPVPDFIFEDVMLRERDAMLENLKYMNERGDELGGFLRAPDGAVRATQRQILERKLKGVPLSEYSHIEAQRAFYKKYIDAGGIAIVANAGVTDAELIDARTVLLTMTSKHPRLRDRLYMEHGFYMILLERWTWGWDIPEVIVVSPFWEMVNSCNIASHGLWIDSEGAMRKPLGLYGFCYARLDQGPRFTTFVHEFAHALESEMTLLDPDFPARVKRAQAQSNMPTAYRVWGEFWADSVEYWFYGIEHDLGPSIEPTETYESFFQREPLLAKLLDEWFPRVSFIKLGKR